MYVLDTNVVSELRKAKAGKANSGVAEWASEVPAALMFISVVSTGERSRATMMTRWLI